MATPARRAVPLGKRRSALGQFAGGTIARAVVMIKTFAVEIALPLGVTDVGDIVHVDAAGAPPQLSETS